MLDFDDFYVHHYATVVGSLRLAVGARSEAEDAAQEAFARALLKWTHVSTLDRPSTWVYVVAIRALRRQQRRHEARPAAEHDRSGLEAAPDHADTIASTNTIEQALDTLAPRQRMAVVLRFQADLTVREVGRAMRCSEGTVKSTLHAALSRLRVELGENDLDEDDLEGVQHGRR